MEIVERAEFYERYKFRPSRFESMAPGDIYRSKRHGDFKVLQKKMNNASGFYGCIVVEHEGDEMAVDLSTHWERGPQGPIHLCEQGVVNLIGGVMTQAEKDLEKYYAGGEREFVIEPLIDSKGREVFESSEAKAKRRKMLFAKAVKECEELLGPTFSRYAEIKAYYNLLHLSVDEIAIKMGDDPYRIACVVDRLGLNRSNIEQEDMFSDMDEEISDYEF